MLTHWIPMAALVVALGGAAQSSSVKPGSPAKPAAAAEAPAPKTDTAHLVVTTSSAVRGGRLELVIDVAPKAHMHVYAPEQPDVIPIAFTLEKHDGVSAAPPQFPKPESFVFQDQKQLVYSKPFRIVQPVARKSGGGGEPLVLKGTLRYQACDEAVCYRPVDVPLTWTVAAAAAK